MGLFGPPNVDKMKAKRDIQGLVKALGYTKDALVRQAAARALGELRGAQAVEPLISAIHRERANSYNSRLAAAEASNDETFARRKRDSLIMQRVCEEAAWALGQIDDSRAVALLRAALKDKDGAVCGAAAEALGRIDVKLLFTALQEEDISVRRHAAEALGRLGNISAVEPLIAALKDKDPHMRQAVSEALVRIGAPAVERLNAALRDEDGDVREVTATVLGQIRDSRAVESLLVTLQYDVYHSVRQAAAAAIGKIGDVRALESLVIALRDSHERVRLTAAKALGKTGNTGAVEPLLDTLQYDVYHNVRCAAAEALGKIGDLSAVDPLIAALQDEFQEVRQSAAEALDRLSWRPGSDENGAHYWIAKGTWGGCVKIGAPATGPLLTALKYKGRQVREGAAVALAQLGWHPAPDENGARYWIAKGAWDECVKVGAPATEPLLVALEERQVREGAAAALDQLGWHPAPDANGARYWIAKQKWDECTRIGAHAVEPLIAALNYREEKEVRTAAATALGTIGDVRAVEPLIAMLKGTEVMVRWVVAKALGQIADARAVEPLVSALKDEEWMVRAAAAEALGQIGDARVVELLIAALEDKANDTRVRNAAISALGNIGDTRAVESLIAVLQGNGWEMHRSAAIALGNLGDARAVGPLIVVLNDKRHHWLGDTRQVATEALGRIGDASAVGWLVATLKVDGEDREVRRAAAGALGRIGDARAVEPLIAVLGADAGTRRAAARALVSIYGRGQLDPALRQLILAKRDNMIERHVDYRTGECPEEHTDMGIGVDFPL